MVRAAAQPEVCIEFHFILLYYFCYVTINLCYSTTCSTTHKAHPFFIPLCLSLAPFQPAVNSAVVSD